MKFNVTFWLSLLCVVLALVVIFGILMIANGIHYDTELGFYDTRAYSFTVGEFIESGTVHYTYINLDFIGIIERIFA